MLIKNIHYITKNLKERFNFDPTVKSKPVSDIDSLELALSHHWRRDTSMFPSERQRLQVPAVFPLCAGTGARPGEFVDASVPNPNQSEVTNNPNFQEGNRTLCKALCSEDVRIFWSAMKVIARRWPWMSGWLTIKGSIIVQNRKLVYRLGSCFNVADLVRYVSRTIFLFTKRVPSFAPSPISSHWHLWMTTLRPLHWRMWRRWASWRSKNPEKG